MESLDLLRSQEIRRMSQPDPEPPLPTLVFAPGAFQDAFRKAETSVFEGLGPGSEGPAVRRLQQVLQRWNPRLAVESSGVFDERTDRAMALYQAIYSGRPGKTISNEVSGYLKGMEDGSFWRDPPLKSPGQQLLYQAAQSLGKPYQLGGDGHSSTDCGRLVQMAASKISPQLSRCADEQFRAAQTGQHGLSLSQTPRPGDLLFFRFPTHQQGQAYGGVTHVGIHVSPQWTLAASSGAGKVVLQRSAPLSPYLAAAGSW